MQRPERSTITDTPSMGATRLNSAALKRIQRVVEGASVLLIQAFRPCCRGLITDDRLLRPKTATEGCDHSVPIAT
jgi:hypothetical protein